MTKSKRNEWIAAIDKLLAWYVDGVEIHECPLCDIAADHCTGCPDCLYVLFENMPICKDDLADPCGHYSRDNGLLEFNVEQMRKRRSARWTTDAIKRLNRWKLRLNEMEVTG